MAAAKGNDYVLKRKVNPQHTKAEINKIINDLLEWAVNDDGIHIETYIFKTYKKNKSWLHNLAQTHPEMKEAIEQAKLLLSGKIHNHSWIGDRNSVFGEKILPLVDPEYKAWIKEKANLDKETIGEGKKLVDAFLEGIKALSKNDTSK